MCRWCLTKIDLQRERERTKTGPHPDVRVVYRNSSSSGYVPFTVQGFHLPLPGIPRPHTDLVRYTIPDYPSPRPRPSVRGYPPLSRPRLWSILRDGLGVVLSVHEVLRVRGRGRDETKVSTSPRKSGDIGRLLTGNTNRGRVRFR